MVINLIKYKIDFNKIPVHTMHEHLLRTILSTQKTKKNIKILDAGCGNLDLTKYLSENLKAEHFENVEFFGYEIDQKHDQDKLSMIITNDEVLSKMNLLDSFFVISLESYTLPFRDNFFDIIISNQVVEHVADFDSFFYELDRVLKVNGIQIHAYPTKEILIEPHLKIPLAHRISNKKYLFNYLKTVYRLKRRVSDDFLSGKVDYMMNKTNYRFCFHHFTFFENLGYKVMPNFSLFFPFVKLQRIMGNKRRFKYFSFGLFESFFIQLSSYFYSITLIIKKRRSQKSRDKP